MLRPWHQGRDPVCKLITEFERHKSVDVAVQLVVEGRDANLVKELECLVLIVSNLVVEFEWDKSARVIQPEPLRARCHDNFWVGADVIFAAAE